MNEQRAAMRLAVAQGHWGLGEFEEALDSLARGLDEAPGYLPIVEFIETIEGQPPELALARKLATLRERVAPALAAGREHEEILPLQSSTVAELLADQGHELKALRVAEEVLRKNPGDERARAVKQRLAPPSRERERWIAELERWLANAKKLRHRREAHG
jgi:tetratricopeptide (TPR) repeat protein